MRRVLGLCTIVGNLRHARAITVRRTFGADRVKVRRVFGMKNLGDVMRFRSTDHEPVDAVEERMVLDIVHATVANSLVSARAEMKNKIFGFGRELCLSWNIQSRLPVDNLRKVSIKLVLNVEFIHQTLTKNRPSYPLRRFVTSFNHSRSCYTVQFLLQPAMQFFYILS